MIQTKHRGQGTGRSLADSPGHLLHRAQQLAADVYAAHLPRAELTIRELDILSAVGANPGLTQAKLVRVTGIDRSTLADLIARLQERGLVARGRMEKDARAKSVSLTAEGKAALETCTPAANTADQAVLKALAKGKRDLFVALLQQIIEELDARERKRAKKRAQQSKEMARKEKKRRKLAPAPQVAPHSPVAEAEPAAMAEAGPMLAKQAAHAAAEQSGGLAAQRPPSPKRRA